MIEMNAVIDLLLFIELQSTVCQKIIEALAENSTDKNIHRRVEIISQDCFYKPLSEAQKVAAAKGQFDFDHPGLN